ncbi:MAG TPA: hypothetical protein PLK35_03225 [Candidatus Moranbacteria bacterium]|nr:hypothetical protein [Candidatus Moranbacteria bacterium]
MNFSDIFAETKEVSFTIGFFDFSQNGENGRKVPCISFNLGHIREPLGEQLAYNSKIFLEVELLENGMFAYIIYGDHIKAGIIFNEKNKTEIVKEIFFDFSATIRIDKKCHEAFQDALRKVNFWLLCIQTIVDAYLVIDKNHNILTIMEITDCAPPGTLLN